MAVQAERVLSKDDILARYLNTVYMGDSMFGVEAASPVVLPKPPSSSPCRRPPCWPGCCRPRASTRPAPTPRRPRAAATCPRPHGDVPHGHSRRGGQGPGRERQWSIPRPGWRPLPVLPGLPPDLPPEVRKGYSPNIVYRREPADRDHPRPPSPGAAQNIRDDRRCRQAQGPRGGAGVGRAADRITSAPWSAAHWDDSKVNLALGRLGGGSGRQAGSSFKPFVLARAFEPAHRPTRRYSAPSCITPRGFDKPGLQLRAAAATASVDLRTATEKSINTVFAQLIVDVGIKQTAELAKRLGITSIDLEQAGSTAGSPSAPRRSRRSTWPRPSACSPTTACGPSPTPVLTITDRDGDVLEDNTQSRPDQAGARGIVADNVTNVLTGRDRRRHRHRGRHRPPGGRQDRHVRGCQNAWFVGYTPMLSTAVWMGYTDRATSRCGGPRRRLRGRRHLAGPHLARLHGRSHEGRRTAAVLAPRPRCPAGPSMRPRPESWPRSD